MGGGTEGLTQRVRLHIHIYLSFLICIYIYSIYISYSYISSSRLLQYTYRVGLLPWTNDLEGRVFLPLVSDVFPRGHPRRVAAEVNGLQEKKNISTEIHIVDLPLLDSDL